jgi:ABC-type dipeptide/oligopeptide/nickel transport system permease component
VILDQILMAIPPFFFGIVSCFVFGIILKWFMPGNFISLSESVSGCISYLILPAICLALPRIAMTSRMLRSSIQEELTQNYVYTARSRGLSRVGIMRRHILKNAMIPVVTFLAVSAAETMTGTIIIEQVFTIPGTGRLLVSSIWNRDFPVVQAIIVILAAWIVIVNFAADMLNHWMDPRLRQ